MTVLNALLAALGALLAGALALLWRLRYVFGRERRQLRDEIARLGAALPPADIAQELRRARAEAEQAVRERDRARTRVALLENSSAEALTERDALGRSRDELVAERDRLADECDRVTAERDELADRRDKLTAKHERLLKDHKRLSEELAGIRSQRDEAQRVADEEASRRKQAEERALPRDSAQMSHPGMRAQLDRIRSLIDPGGTSAQPLSNIRDLLPVMPQHPSLSADAVADSVVDGADLGAVVVRAVSTCGDRHRRERQHRRDAVLLRMPTAQGRRHLLSTVAAGAPDGAWSQSAAAHVCRALETQVVRNADFLAEALDRPATDPVPPGAQAALRLALGNVGRAVEVEGKQRGWIALDGSPAERAIATGLTAVLTPLDDRQSRTHLVFGVGDGSVLRLRKGRWEQVFAAAGTAGATAGPLPDNTAVNWALVETLPRELLVVCTRPMTDLLLREDTGRQFADLWSAGQPTLPWFLSSVVAKVEAAVEDRSLVCLWDFGYAADAEEDRFWDAGPVGTAGSRVG
ncbi:hypothetical protein [Streptomyces herbicida]|uniref:hypothetical protein n=1 Tax=Streptomyces herbicida TaxID=3065675 RepID=UPI00292EC895|nr:hypothetical protein [Streptomyces sp. NEAU-HV9]